MSTEGSTDPIGPTPPASGRLLLLASLAVWTISTATVFALSTAGGSTPICLAVFGGVASGLLAGARSRLAATTSDPGVWLFRIITNLIGAGIGFLVIGFLGAGSDLDPRWGNFLLGMFAYSVVRDLVKTSSNMRAAQRAARFREEERVAQSDMVMELIVLSGSPARASTKVFRLPYDG